MAVDRAHTLRRPQLEAEHRAALEGLMLAIRWLEAARDRNAWIVARAYPDSPAPDDGDADYDAADAALDRLRRVVRWPVTGECG